MSKQTAASVVLNAEEAGAPRNHVSRSGSPLVPDAIAAGNSAHLMVKRFDPSNTGSNYSFPTLSA